MEFVPLLIMSATVKKLVDFVPYVLHRRYNAIALQLLAWAGGIGVVALAAQTPWAAALEFGGVSLAASNFLGQVFVGIGVGSAASAALVDVPNALDPTRQSVSLPLVGPRSHT